MHPYHFVPTLVFPVILSFPLLALIIYNRESNGVVKGIIGWSYFIVCTVVLFPLYGLHVSFKNYWWPLRQNPSYSEMKMVGLRGFELAGETWLSNTLTDLNGFAIGFVVMILVSIIPLYRLWNAHQKSALIMTFATTNYLWLLAVFLFLDQSIFLLFFSTIIMLPILWALQTRIPIQPNTY